jgi:hypothetical protein
MKYSNLDKKFLFDIIVEKTKNIGIKESIALDAAFQKWFMNMYLQNPKDIVISDGARDGKIDSFCKVIDIDTVSYKIFNSKFTKHYDKQAPSQFYDEIIAFNKLFVNSDQRSTYLQNYIKKDMKNQYKILFDVYDKGNGNLFFITNYKKNNNQYSRIEDLDLNVFHLEDILQFIVDDIEGAMPITHSLLLTGIHNILSADTVDTLVPTSIVFARLRDFINYMKRDPFDLLFSRNVRLNLGNTEPNINIKDTFRDNPKEFAFSNNGITLLTEEIKHTPGNKELLLKNPRVVNGSQTLHSIRDVPRPPAEARVMVRIVEIPPFNPNDFTDAMKKRKDIITKISIRSNLQNPITKWNLAANDDFQMELKRYFRQKGFFYETRKKEWDFRKTELKNVGILKGPYLPKLTQLIASYYYGEKYLGPGTAKQSINDLFVAEKAYSIIRNTDPVIVYQIYILNELINFSFYDLRNFQYINNIKQYARLAIFSIYVKLIAKKENIWGSKKFSEFLEWHYNNYNPNLWKKITKSIISNIILPIYKKQRKKYLKTEETDLVYNNYFKNQTFMNSLLNITNGTVKKQIGMLLREI